MCDAYEDERMVAFWRRLEDLERREGLPAESEARIEPAMPLAPMPAVEAKARPRPLRH